LASVTNGLRRIYQSKKLAIQLPGARKGRPTWQSRVMRGEEAFRNTAMALDMRTGGQNREEGGVELRNAPHQFRRARRAGDIGGHFIAISDQEKAAPCIIRCNPAMVSGNSSQRRYRIGMGIDSHGLITNRFPMEGYLTSPIELRSIEHRIIGNTRKSRAKLVELEAMLLQPAVKRRTACITGRRRPCSNGPLRLAASTIMSDCIANELSPRQNEPSLCTAGAKNHSAGRKSGTER